MQSATHNEPLNTWETVKSATTGKPIISVLDIWERAETQLQNQHSYLASKLFGLKLAQREPHKLLTETR